MAFMSKLILEWLLRQARICEFVMALLQKKTG